jgi:hypothetical protein
LSVSDPVGLCAAGYLGSEGLVASPALAMPISVTQDHGASGLVVDVSFGHALRGRIVDADGQGLGGFAVDACPLPGPPANSCFVDPAYSSRDGTFALGGLPASRYAVMIRSPDDAGRPAAFGAPHGLTDAAAGAASFTLNQIDTELPAITVPTGFFARLGADMTGRVTDRHGTPIPKVTVGLLDLNADRYTGEARTAADGTYVIGGISPGSYIFGFGVGYGGALAGWYAPGGLLLAWDAKGATKLVVGQRDLVGMDVVAP